MQKKRNNDNWLKKEVVRGVFVLCGAIVAGLIGVYGEPIRFYLNTIVSSSVAKTAIGVSVLSVVGDILLYLKVR